jgi:hypothetical protein
MKTAPLVIAFALVLAVALFAIFVDAPLSWDGAFLLFRSLDMRRPAIPHDRYSVALFEAPALLLSRFTDHLRILRLAFGAVYASLPLVALTLSWRVVRVAAPQLMIWPFFGMCLATLGGQLMFVSECAIALHFAWPLLLIAITDRWRERWALALGLSLLLLFLHPIAPFLLLTVAATTALQSRVARRRQKLPLLLLLTAVAGAQLYLASSQPYQIATASLLPTLWHSVATPPLFCWTAIAAGALLLLVRRDAAWPKLAVAATLAVTALSSIAWAAKPAAWQDALNHRFVAPLLAAPFFIFALVDGLGGLRRASPDARGRFAILIAATFAATLGVQCLLWHQLTRALVRETAARPEACVSLDSLSSVRNTALKWWPTTFYSMLLQGRAPTHLVLPDDECGSAELARGIPLPGGGLRPRARPKLWFDLRAAGLPPAHTTTPF